ncbi:MAG: AIR synthase related protein [Candidatus Helarchaeota archaeon]
MDLKELVKKVAQFEGITRKYPISTTILPLMEILEVSKPFVDILGAFGEDAAIFKVSEASSTHLFLLAMDGIWSKLIQADPEIAGYFGVLVNVNDIVCKGGIPIALVDLLSYRDEAIGAQIMKGMVKGAKKFGVPIVGGHLHPSTEVNSLTLAIFGVVPKEEVIFSSSARVGDDIIIAVDLDGRRHEKFPYAWDTTTHKTPIQVQMQEKLMRTLATKKLVHAAKDISNPGMIGTLGMLLDASKKGGNLDITRIPYNEAIPLDHWVCMYPGFGIVLTCAPNVSREIIAIFSRGGITATICGTVLDTHSLTISQDKEAIEVFNFKQHHLAGIP